MNAESSTSALTRNVLHLSVVVAALGYFVDIYDLILFAIVRVPSLKGLGIAGSELLQQGVFLLNMQMAGMLAGGILWGILGDKRGRLTVLFGSILLYSLANIANAAVTSLPMYAVLRFVAGVGLAGELGAAVTLVTETLHVSKRGYGTALIAGVGLLGAVAAGFVAEVAHWRMAYLIGGILGLGLLVLRIRLSESGMFHKLSRQEEGISRGDLRLLLATPRRWIRYLACILVAVPVWYLIAVLVTFSPEFAVELGTTGPVSAGRAIAFCYAGASVGGILAGTISQYFSDRKRVIFLFLIFTALLIPAFLEAKGTGPEVIYWICTLMGIGGGYWSVFMTTAAEQFGTNLRATVTTTIPNFVRGSVVPVTSAFEMLRRTHSLRASAAIVGAAVMALAFVAVTRLEETSKKDLDFIEV